MRTVLGGADRASTCRSGGCPRAVASSSTPTPSSTRWRGIAAEAGMELSLFARPNAGWGTSAMARSAVGAARRPDRARPGAARGRRRRRPPCGRPRRPQRAGRRPRRTRRCSAGSGTAATCRPTCSARCRSCSSPRNAASCAPSSRISARTRSTSRPTCRWRRSRPSAPGRRHPARHLRGVTGQHRRVRPPPRDPGPGERRRAGLPEVRAAQRTRRLPGRAVTSRRPLSHSRAERVRRAQLGYELMQRTGVDLTTSERDAPGLAVPPSLTGPRVGPTQVVCWSGLSQ